MHSARRRDRTPSRRAIDRRRAHHPWLARRALHALGRQPELGRARATCAIARSILRPWRPTVSRPAWELRARSLSDARASSCSLGLGAARAASRCCCARAQLGVGYWIDEGLSVGIAARPLTDIPGVLRQDGSPPLYYMLLHVWMALFGDAARRRRTRCRCCSRCCRAGRVLWARARAVRRRAGVDRAPCCTALNPFLTQYAQETRMYSLVALLALLATRVLPARVHVRRAPARRWPVVRASRSRRCSTRTTGRCSSASRCASPGSAARAGAGAPSAAALLRDGAARLRRRALLYLPWVPTLLFQAAHTGAPWSRKPRSRRSMRRRTGCSATRRVVLVLAAGGGLVALLRAGRGRRRRARAAPSLASARRARGRCCSPGCPRRSRRRGRCATWRSRSRRSCCSRRRARRAPGGSGSRRSCSSRSCGATTAAGRRRATCATVAEAIGAEPRARATSSSRRSPSRSRCSHYYLPPRAALRDAHRPGRATSA